MLKGAYLSLLLWALFCLIALWAESSDAAGGFLYLEQALVGPDDDSSGLEGISGHKKKASSSSSTTTTTHKTASTKSSKTPKHVTTGHYGKRKAATTPHTTTKKNSELEERLKGVSAEEKEWIQGRKVEGTEGIETAEREYDMRMLQKMTLLSMVDTMRTKYGVPLFGNKNAEDQNGQRENTWMAELLEQFKGTQGQPNIFTANFSRQVEGDFRGGLIPFYSLTWEYSARDVSQANGPIPPRRRQEPEKNNQRVDLQLTPTGNPLTNALFGNNEDSFLCIQKAMDRASVPLFNGALRNVPTTDEDTCTTGSSYFNGVLEIPLNYRGTAESLLFFFGGAVISRYSLVQPANHSLGIVEEVCFDYPVLAYSYARTGDVSPVERIAHSCHEGFCSKYLCACETIFSTHDSFNIAPLFCSFFDFFQEDRPLQSQTQQYEHVPVTSL